MRRVTGGGCDDGELWPLRCEVSDGVMQLGGVAVTTLARLCGTPLYVIDEADFRERAREWREESGAAKVHYASKAFLCSELVRWVESEGLHLDVCSAGELELALAAGFDPGRIVLHGNNKSTAELELAVQRGVGVVVVDSADELARLSDLARGRRPQDIYVRVAVGVDAQTHRSIATGGDDVKFGFPITGGGAERALLQAAVAPGVRLAGVHSHLGSQLLSTSGLQDAARRVGELVRTLADQHRIQVRDVDLGGGAGIAYLPGQRRLTAAEFGTALREGLAAEIDPSAVRLAVEPGRSLIGTAGVTLYRVGVVKDGLQRRFVAVDGGMSDAPRPALYGAPYTARIVNRTASGEPTRTVVVGRHCETGDVVVPDLDLPSDVVRGDLLAVAATGAYHHAMASNYNLQPRPAVVSVRDGQVRLLVRRETQQDLMARDCGAVPVGPDRAPTLA